MAHWEWGRIALGKTEFSKFLLDRFTDDSKRAAEWRMDMLKLILRSDGGAERAFGSADTVLFKAYIAEGVYFRAPAVSVAVESL